MPLRQARALFERHQSRFRHGAIEQRAIEHEWRGKTTAQKKLIQQALQRLLDAEQAVRDNTQDGPHTQIEVKDIMQVIDDEARDLKWLKAQIGEVLEPYKVLHRLIIEVQAAWQALADLKRSQRRSRNQASVAHAQRSAAMRAHQAATIGGKIARFESEQHLARRNAQPVPVDSDGREIMPRDWIGEGDFPGLCTAAKAQRDDLVAEELRMADARQYKWVPWQKLGDMKKNTTEG